MAWWDVHAEERYAEQRKDAQFVAKKKKYLKAYHKKNHAKEGAYRAKRLKEHGDEIRARRRAWKAKRSAANIAKGLRYDGKPRMTKEEFAAMMKVISSKLTRKQRVLNGINGHKTVKRKWEAKKKILLPLAKKIMGKNFSKIANET